MSCVHCRWLLNAPRRLGRPDPGPDRQGDSRAARLAVESRSDASVASAWCGRVDRLLFGNAVARYQQHPMPILFLIVFIDLVGFGLVIPLLPFYAERFAASPLQMTTLFATFSLMAMVTAP